MKEINIAIAMETDAIAFYTDAAGKTSHPVGKRMFLSIAQDERRHLEYLNAILKDMNLKPEPVNPMDRIKTIFNELKDQMLMRLKATTDDIEVLRIAMNMEKEGYEYYKRLAGELKDEKLRNLFSILMAEEKKHYEMFSNTHAFITDTGNWFMWSEHSIVEG